MTAGRGIRHAWLNRGSIAWQFQTLDHPNTAARNCAAAEFNGQLHVFGHQGNGLLHHAWFDRQNWRFELLDTIPNGSTGVDAATITFGGRLHVFSVQAGATPAIRHGSLNMTGQWVFNTLNAGASLGGFCVSVFNQALHLFSTPPGSNRWNGVLHGSMDLNGNWTAFNRLDVGTSNGTNAALTYGNQLHIFGHAAPFALPQATDLIINPETEKYFAPDNHVPLPPGVLIFPSRSRIQAGIRHGFFDGITWRFETIDPDGSYPGPNVTATAFSVPNGQSRLDVFSWLNSSSTPTHLRHVYFVP
jgi:hypothetical protein